MLDTKPSDSKLYIVGRDLLFVMAMIAVMMLALLIFAAWLIFLPLEISILLNLSPVSTLGVCLLNLLIGGVIMIYLEYRTNPKDFNIKGLRYIFTYGH